MATLLSQALMRAGDMLLVKLREQLANLGLSGELSLVMESHRVTVGCRSPILRDLESGRIGVPPAGLFERTACEAHASLKEEFGLGLRGAERE